jgi:hypothetical protein
VRAVVVSKHKAAALRAVSVADCVSASAPAPRPGKGPKADLFTWGLSQTGSRPNADLGQPISFTQPTGLKYVLARSDQASPYPNCGPGDTGWVQLYANNTFGCMKYADANIIDSVCGSFEVAYCNHCPSCPKAGAPPPTPAPARPPSCPPCPPPPPPPAPPGGQPCIRFGHAIASTETVTFTITRACMIAARHCAPPHQPLAALPRTCLASRRLLNHRVRCRSMAEGATVYTWSNYKFSQFSDWGGCARDLARCRAVVCPRVRA